MDSYLSWFKSKLPPAVQQLAGNGNNNHGNGAPAAGVGSNAGKRGESPSPSPAASAEKPAVVRIKKISPAERLKSFEEALVKPTIDVDYIRYLCWQGIPDTKPGLRQICWKVLLGYLPLQTAEWPASLKQSRKLFAEFSKELLVETPAPKQSDHVHPPISTPISTPLHNFTLLLQPLSLEQDSNWNNFFKDSELMHEIDKDVRRTFPHLHFFRGETERHYESLRHILFIWAKLNPGIKYVQGMNEVLAPLYYLFATDPDDSYREHAKADSFFCFTNIMSEIMNNFIKTLDKSEMGIVKKMEELNLILKEKDHQLWQQMDEKQLNPQFYSFRWITLLLSQEFDLPDVFRLWDTLFADVFRFKFLLYICCAMIIQIREKLLESDFAENLKLLQQYPPTDMEALITLATELRDNPEYQAPIWVPPVRPPTPTIAVDPQNPSLGAV